MKFDKLYEQLIGEAMHDEDRDLFQQALEILQDLKAKSPNAYAKLMARLNDMSSQRTSTKTIQMSPNPEDASWIG
jgi:ribosomal protein S3AE